MLRLFSCGWSPCVIRTDVRRNLLETCRRGFAATVAMLLTVGIGFLYQRKKAAASSLQLFALVRLRPTAIFSFTAKRQI